MWLKTLLRLKNLQLCVLAKWQCLYHGMKPACVYKLQLCYLFIASKQSRNLIPAKTVRGMLAGLLAWGR